VCAFGCVCPTSSIAYPDGAGAASESDSDGKETGDGVPLTPQARSTRPPVHQERPLHDAECGYALEPEETGRRSDRFAEEAAAAVTDPPSGLVEELHVELEQQREYTDSSEPEDTLRRCARLAQEAAAAVTGQDSYELHLEHELLRERLIQRTAELEGAQRRLFKQQRTVQDVKKTNRKLREDKEVAAKAAKHVCKKLRDVESQRDAATARLNVATRERDAASHERDAATTQLEDVTEALNVATRERDAATTQLKDVTEALNAATHERDAATTQLKDVTEALNVATREHDAATTQLEEVTEALNAATREHDAATTQLEEVTEALNAATHERDAATTQLEEVTEALNAATREHDATSTANMQLTEALDHATTGWRESQQAVRRLLSETAVMAQTTRLSAVHSDQARLHSTTGTTGAWLIMLCTVSMSMSILFAWSPNTSQAILASSNVWVTTGLDHATFVWQHVSTLVCLLLAFLVLSRLLPLAVRVPERPGRTTRYVVWCGLRRHDSPTLRFGCFVCSSCFVVGNTGVDRITAIDQLWASLPTRMMVLPVAERRWGTVAVMFLRPNMLPMVAVMIPRTTFFALVMAVGTQLAS